MVEAKRLMSVTEARAIAVHAHGDQRDRDGSFHIAHVARVAERAPGDDAHQRVAWLHDVIEDNPAAATQIADRLPDVELEAIELLTHVDPGVTYADYIAAIAAATGSAGALARAIKQADMLDNLSRCARDHDPAIAQYAAALAALWTTARD
jgi:(p)ppGpp synthase/HD superfamily hydrolase